MSEAPCPCGQYGNHTCGRKSDTWECGDPYGGIGCAEPRCTHDPGGWPDNATMHPPSRTIAPDHPVHLAGWIEGHRDEFIELARDAGAFNPDMDLDGLSVEALCDVLRFLQPAASVSEPRPVLRELVEAAEAALPRLRGAFNISEADRLATALAAARTEGIGR